MPTNVKVIHARDFVRATPGGVLDLEASEALLTDIARAASSVDDCEVLLDTRRAIPALGTADLWLLAQHASRHHTTFVHKTAVLCPLERFDHARFFAMCSSSHGMNIRAFTTYEDAMEWLIAEDQPTDRAGG